MLLSFVGPIHLGLRAIMYLYFFILHHDVRMYDFLWAYSA